MVDEKKTEEYPISPMHRHLKQVVWMQLMRETSPYSLSDGKVHRMKWLFKPEDFPCGACGRFDLVDFMVLPTGVYRSCKVEGMTEKVDPIDEGEKHYEAVLLEDTILTDNQDAIDVIKRYKQERIFLDEDSKVELPP